MRFLVSTSVTMALVASALIILPMLMENTSSTCSAYVAKQYSIAPSLSDASPGDGPGGRVKLAAGMAAETEVKGKYPGDPPCVVCAVLYWQQVLKQNQAQRQAPQEQGQGAPIPLAPPRSYQQ